MADVAEHTTYTDAAMAISRGKRHLLVQDYTAAVTALADGLEMMSQKLGECDDALGEPYLLYGRALLGLAREEVNVFGEGVPGSEEADEDDEDDEDEEENEEDDKASETEVGKEDDDESVADEEKRVSSGKEEARKENVAVEKKNEEVAAASNKTDDKKIEEARMDSASKESIDGSGVVVAGTSKDAPPKNDSVSGKSGNCNGTAGTSTAAQDEDDDVNKDEDEEDPGRGIDLQVAWEVLELAKIVFAKRGEAGLKHLAETHRLLGEVAMESDNHQGAIADLEGALGLLEKIEPREPRALADIRYQLGLAHSLVNDFDASIKQFAEATSLLEARIRELEETPESAIKRDDPFYTVEGEIRELRELLPAIEEKIADIRDFKEEACRLVIEGIKSKVASGSCANGSSASGDGVAGSSEKTEAGSPSPKLPASDISHLVRKKRKHENDTDDRVQSPCKKATP